MELSYPLMLLAAVSALSALAVCSWAQSLSVLPRSTGCAKPSKMLERYLAGLVEQAVAGRMEQYESIKTPAQIRKYIRAKRKTMIDQLGGFPKRTPLEPRTVGRIKRDGYTVEKVIYQSQPDHYVTALMYLPAGSGRHPGVLIPCGHAYEGKAAPNYQRAGILLATHGIAALCYDSTGMGERHQYLPPTGDPYGCVQEHMICAPGSILVGKNLATYQIWDGIRSIDYLISRKEVDGSRIGCTGNSGGGMKTSYLMALDDRIKVAAPSCFLMGMGNVVRTIGLQDAEQNLHAQIALGLDHADYLIMHAPNPALVCCATRDFFDIESTWETYRQAKRIYMRLGYSERIDIAETDNTHGFWPELRQTMVRWMRRRLMGVDEPIFEGKIDILPVKKTYCTPTGETLRLAGAKSVFDMNGQAAAKLAARRRKLWKTNTKAAMLQKVRQVTGIRRLSKIPPAKVTAHGVIRRKGYRIEKLILTRIDGVPLPCLRFAPAGRSIGMYLYLNATGKATCAKLGGPIEKLTRQGYTVLTADLSGIGETATVDQRSDMTALAGDGWRMAQTAYVMNKSLLAMQAEDVLTLGRFAATKKSGPNRVLLVTVGNVGAPALHAAALEADIFRSVTIQAALGRWSSIVADPAARGLLTQVVHGALGIYDLDDLAQTLGDKLTLS